MNMEKFPVSKKSQLQAEQDFKKWVCDLSYIQGTFKLQLEQKKENTQIFFSTFKIFGVQFHPFTSKWKNVCWYLVFPTLHILQRCYTPVTSNRWPMGLLWGGKTQTVFPGTEKHYKVVSFPHSKCLVQGNPLFHHANSKMTKKHQKKVQ